MAVALVVCLVGAVLAGCSPVSSPTSVVTSFFNALKQGRYAAASALIENPGEAQFPAEGDPTGQMLKAYFSRLSYEVMSTEVKGTQATVRVKVTLPDLAGIMMQIISQALPAALAGSLSGQPAEAQAAVLQLFQKAFQDPKSPTTTTEVPISLTKAQGKWLIVGDDQLAAALTGNVAEALQNAFPTGE